MSESQRFLLEDSSSSDDLDIDELILDDDVEQAMVIVAVKNLQDRMAMKRRRGSVPGRITIPQNRATGHEALMQDYFAEVPTYTPSLFHRRYRMRRELFVKIVKACEANCRYFTRRRNNAGAMGFSPYQKISAAMRVIAYGILADYTDEYLRIGENTTILSVWMFAKTIIRVFFLEYL
jgi:L-lysine 2,3-aminomutase